jgi:hypothetical protein
MLSPEWRLTADCFFQIRHLHCGERGFKALVAGLEPGAIDCLLERVTGEHAERMRYSSLLGGLTNASRDLIGDHVVVCSVSAKKAADADDGVVFARLSERAGGGRDLESAGDTDEIDVLLLRSGT